MFVITITGIDSTRDTEGVEPRTFILKDLSVYLHASLRRLLLPSQGILTEGKGGKDQYG
jgi:hypothetical protein